ncbi:MAG: DUF1800 domain-containing protein, partial [Acetobacteraceae bacterium]|nr:DUF1800 domain-containing protein [Acetobacteraceae bacterium]
TAASPFRERLVWFWANHFTVSVRGGPTAALAGAFVQEAIRPHVTGHFADMLLAAVRHPAMLLYLNNAGSVGPDSPAGLRTGRGLNENLARECLELHTVGASAGYAQADVTAFAAVLTGWSVAIDRDPGGFLFRDRAHQPGDKVVLGRMFPEGELGGVQAVGFLAGHPATHRRLATKLARHFVADDPPVGAIAAIEAALRDSGGDLGAATRAVLALSAAWEPLGKLRAPQDYALAVLRAAALPPDARPDVLGIFARLGQPLFGAPLPNGWGDVAAEWCGPDQMLRRVDWAYTLAGGLGDGTDPARCAEASLGPLLRPATATALRRAGSRHDALALLFAAPEFQRR